MNDSYETDHSDGRITKTKRAGAEYMYDRMHEGGLNRAQSSDYAHDKNKDAIGIVLAGTRRRNPSVK